MAREDSMYPSQYDAGVRDVQNHLEALLQQFRDAPSYDYPGGDDRNRGQIDACRKAFAALESVPATVTIQRFKPGDTVPAGAIDLRGINPAIVTSEAFRQWFNDMLDAYEAGRKKGESQ